MQTNDHVTNEINRFIRFKSSIDTIKLPERFTFPFYYQPHPLCVLASEELQKYLSEQNSWQYDFTQNGKMFGVLLVENTAGEIGYLTGFSGKLANKTVLDNFVPPVDDSTNAEFFLSEQKIINGLNDQLTNLTKSPELIEKEQLLKEIITSAKEAITRLQSTASENKKKRKTQRSLSEASLSSDDFILLKATLAKESVADKNELKYLKQHWQEQITQAEKSVNTVLDVIIALKEKRTKMSSALQKTLFEQYRFLNCNNQEKNLTELFVETAFHQKYGVPPAGAGDCAAPKLLQYAFKHKLKPLAMAEFWWGKSPKSEVRQHQNFYTACIGKCQPILTHMLSGMEIDENAMLKDVTTQKVIDIIYQDDYIAVINKPHELLSVPGKSISDCVFSRMKLLFPNATGPLIVHRLDMSTSGLMVIALTKQAYTNLQQQFIKRTVEKRYVALLSGCPQVVKVQGNGLISLPLAGDFDDRPRQMVCFETGKEAETRWELVAIEEKDKQSFARVHLHPKTGRTHQLRVHCAHYQGFNTPIKGDDLYGKKAERLHLHAEVLTLTHPNTNTKMTFTEPAKF